MNNVLTSSYFHDKGRHTRVYKVAKFYCLGRAWVGGGKSCPAAFYRHPLQNDLKLVKL